MKWAHFLTLGVKGKMKDPPPLDSKMPEKKQIS